MLSKSITMLYGIVEKVVRIRLKLSTNADAPVLKGLNCTNKFHHI